MTLLDGTSPQVVSKSSLSGQIVTELTRESCGRHQCCNQSDPRSDFLNCIASFHSLKSQIGITIRFQRSWRHRRTELLTTPTVNTTRTMSNSRLNEINSPFLGSVAMIPTVMNARDVSKMTQDNIRPRTSCRPALCGDVLEPCSPLFFSIWRRTNLDLDWNISDASPLLFRPQTPLTPADDDVRIFHSWAQMISSDEMSWKQNFLYVTGCLGASNSVYTICWSSSHTNFFHRRETWYAANLSRLILTFASSSWQFRGSSIRLPTTRDYYRTSSRDLETTYPDNWI